jgi:transcription termination factor NusB
MPDHMPDEWDNIDQVLSTLDIALDIPEANVSIIKIIPWIDILEEKLEYLESNLDWIMDINTRTIALQGYSGTLNTSIDMQVAEIYDVLKGINEHKEILKRLLKEYVADGKEISRLDKDDTTRPMHGSIVSILYAKRSNSTKLAWIDIDKMKDSMLGVDDSGSKATTDAESNRSRTDIHPLQVMPIVPVYTSHANMNDDILTLRIKGQDEFVGYNTKYLYDLPDSGIPMKSDDGITTDMVEKLTTIKKTKYRKLPNEIDHTRIRDGEICYSTDGGNTARKTKSMYPADADLLTTHLAGPKLRLYKYGELCGECLNVNKEQNDEKIKRFHMDNNITDTFKIPPARIAEEIMFTMNDALNSIKSVDEYVTFMMPDEYTDGNVIESALIMCGIKFTNAALEKIRSPRFSYAESKKELTTIAYLQSSYVAKEVWKYVLKREKQMRKDLQDLFRSSTDINTDVLKKYCLSLFTSILTENEELGIIKVSYKVYCILFP